MDLTFEEKMASVKIITDVMKADGTLHPCEMKFLEKLKAQIGFDIPAVEDAEDLLFEIALATLRQMPSLKKQTLTTLLYEVAISDGEIHDKERHIMEKTFEYLGVDQAP